MEFALDASQHHALSVTRLHTLFKDALFCFWILLGFSYTLRYLKMGELDVLAGIIIYMECIIHLHFPGNIQSYCMSFGFRWIYFLISKMIPYVI